jgi:hypothetical protein
MLASFFIKDDIVHIIGTMVDGKISRHFNQTVRENEDLFGIHYSAFVDRGKGSVNIDLKNKTAEIIDQLPRKAMPKDSKFTRPHHD